MTQSLQLNLNGAITIPAILRKRYRLRRGDALTIVDLGGGFFITPKRSVLPELVGKVEMLREKANLPLEELISGVAQERLSISKEK